MTKKNHKDQNDKPEDLKSEDGIESGEVNQVPVENETEATNSGKTDSTSDDISADDLLDDVRKSLVEDEKQNPKDAKSSWWGRSSKKQAKEPEVEELKMDFDAIPEPPVVDKEEADEYVDQIDELIDILEEETSLPVKSAPAEVKEKPEPELAPEPEPPAVSESPSVPVEELKKRVFSARETDVQDDVSEVRSVALGDAEDVFVEVEAKPVDARQERAQSFENALRPYRQYINFAVAFLAFVVVALVAMVMYGVYQRNRPAQAAATFDPNLPYPKALVLPGGIQFNLGRGVITDGKWNPKGAEWLQGTEICRWVAIPWSAQLEAVVGTFTQTDTIDLIMSNNDKLTYTVNSRREMTLEEMQVLDQNSPCLLLVLAKQDSEKRWVVTALP